MSLIARYKDLCLQNGWKEDYQQLEVVAKLEKIVASFTNNSRWVPTFLKYKQPTYKGVYLYGPVGRGKTMLLDLAFTEAKTTKHRWHFTAFTQMIHQTNKKYANSTATQPIEYTANSIAKKYRLIMIDEFQVTEIADAMVLLRLFNIFMRSGMIVFLSSNLAPEELYKNGLHYNRFAPFIDLIKNNYSVWYLNNQFNNDYRRQHHNNPSFNKKLEDIFNEQLKLEGQELIKLTVNQRKITFDRATHSSVWLNFDDICKVAWGPAEYQAIAQHFTKVYLVNVPQMTENDRDIARRFITLIDCLYDAGVTLYIEAETTPEFLYLDTKENHLPFERTISRLIEMQNQLAIS